MTDDRHETDAIDDLLSGARGTDLPPGLMARVLHDAETLAAARPAAPEPRPWFAGLAGVLRDLGGWPSVAGLAAASAAGLAVGLAAPDMVLPSVSGGSDTVFEIVDLMPGYGIDSAWGE